MRLLLHPDSVISPPDNLQPIVDESFEILVRELGMADSPNDVQVTYTEHTREKGLLGAVSSKRGKNGEHQLLLLATENITKLIYVLCHEMVHVAQHDSGRLAVKDNHQEWEGKSTDRELTDLLKLVVPESLPWEKEAYDRMTPLFAKVIAELPDELRDRMFKTMLAES